jgi:hypothetical protein
MPRPTTAIPRMAPPQEQTPERQNNSYAVFNSRNPKRRLTLQNGGYARACRRGRRPRSAIIGGMLEAGRHLQEAR